MVHCRSGTFVDCSFSGRGKIEKKNRGRYFSRLRLHSAINPDAHPPRYVSIMIDNNDPEDLTNK